MKNKLFIFCSSVLLASCSVYNCGNGISDMKLYSVVNTHTDEKSSVQDWYISEFQTKLLNFSMKFDTYSCDYEDEFTTYNNYWINHVVEDSIKITCNKDVTNGSEIIKAGQLLNKCFLTTKFESTNGYRNVAFLISEKESNNYKFDNMYYTFKVSLFTTDSIIMKDSCVVKRF